MVTLKFILTLSFASLLFMLIHFALKPAFPSIHTKLSAILCVTVDLDHIYETLSSDACYQILSCAHV